MKRIAMQIAAAFGAVAMFVGSAWSADYTLREDEEWLDGRELSGTIDLAGHKLTVVSLTGDATITDSGEPNLIQDGTFEEATIPYSPNLGAYAYFSQGATSSYWEATVPERVGFAKGSPWTSWVSGTKAAYIQGDPSRDVTLQQTVQVPEDGMYLLTYFYTGRPSDSAKPQRLEVRVDDGPVCGFTDDSSSAAVAVKEIVLDLTKGPHTIKFTGTTPHDTWATTVLDDVSLRRICAAGELHVSVPDGQTVEASSVELAGALKLVKEGAGTLVLKKAGQAYRGGTVVADGTLASLVDFSKLPCGIALSAITVGKGAVLDRKGAGGLENYRLVLDGGMLTCTYNSADSDHTCNIRNLELTADSRIVFDAALKVSSDITILGNAVWELNGHVLDIVFDGYDPDVYAKNGMTLRNGTIRTTMASNGWFHDQGINGKDGGCFDLATNLRLECSGTGGAGTYSTVSNLTIRTPNNNVGSSGYQKVYGAYTPLSSYAYKVEMQDGSSLNLGGLTGPWPITPLNSSACTATFADGATIFVDLGERKVKSSEPIVTWSAKPTNVKFQAIPGTVGILTAKDDGLYRHIGFAIIVR